MIQGILDSAKITHDHEEVSTLRDVIDAWNGISAAWDHYRTTLRKALASGVQQAEIARELDRTREMIRRDAMTDEQREALRLADAERKRAARTTRRPRTGAR